MSSRARYALPAWTAFASLLSFVTAPALAQQHDEQLWLQINTNVPIAPGFRVTLEQIARFSDRQDGLYTTEIGGLLGYRVAPGVDLGFGYRRVDAHNGNTAADENRVRQQVIATFGPITTRFRIDERFSEGGAKIGFRIRPLIRYNRQLGDSTALFVSHESFFLPNSTGWGQRRGYERMRNIVGLTLSVGRGTSADIGYLNQYRFARGATPARMEHALSIQLTINLAARPHPVPPTDD